MTNIDYSLLKGKFITFEGGEGSGKSTQVNLLADYLRKKGVDIVQTREPGGTLLGDQLRIILKHPESEISAYSDLLLLQAARRDHIEKIILPGINNEKTIICDRFFDSTIAYQHFGEGISMDFVQNAIDIAITTIDGKRIIPSLTLLFDLDVDVGLARSKIRDEERAKPNTRFEEKKKDYHQRLRQGYLELAKKEPNRFRIIEASQSIDKMHQAVVKIIDEYVSSMK